MLHVRRIASVKFGIFGIFGENSVKIRLYSEVIDSFKSVKQKVYIRFYSVYSVYSVYSDVFEQHSVLFLSVLCFFF